MNEVAALSQADRKDNESLLDGTAWRITSGECRMGAAIVQGIDANAVPK